LPRNLVMRPKQLRSIVEYLHLTSFPVEYATERR